jgi:hypothetical protein
MPVRGNGAIRVDDDTLVAITLVTDDEVLFEPDVHVAPHSRSRTSSGAMTLTVAV